MGLASWPRQMMTPELAVQLAGDWPLYADVSVAELSQFEDENGRPGQPDQLQLNLRCAQPVQRAGRAELCGQSVGLLGSTTDPDATPGQAFYTSIGDLLSGVLRHMVMAHDQPLSGAKDNHDGGH